MDDRKLITINRSGVFSLEDARAVLLIIKKITQEQNREVDSRIQRLENLSGSEVETARELEDEINKLISSWNEKIKKLGAIPKGLWLVDFDAGDGYFCWKFPESDILYWHSYEDGFTGRIPLSERPHSIRPSNLSPIDSESSDFR